MDSPLISLCTVGGNAVSAFLSWRLQATNACDVTLVWKSGFDQVSQYGISMRYGLSRLSPVSLPPPSEHRTHPGASTDPRSLGMNASNLVTVGASSNSSPPMWATDPPPPGTDGLATYQSYGPPKTPAPYRVPLTTSCCASRPSRTCTTWPPSSSRSSHHNTPASCSTPPARSASRHSSRHDSRRTSCCRWCPRPTLPRSAPASLSIIARARSGLVLPTRILRSRRRSSRTWPRPWR